MELFIQIRDGKPFEHPIMGDNLREALPHIDPNNLPPEFARFERIPEPKVGVYECIEGLTYEWVDGIVKDVWHVRPLTDQERLDKQNRVKTQWAAFGYPSWVFNEEKCQFEPPIPMPADAEFANYVWNEPTLSWIEVTPEYHNG